MTIYDDPNREAVGLDPIWTGAGDEVQPTGGYDPGAETVADVQAYVEANPDQRASVLAAEKAGKNRATLVSWLEGG
jgi:hypothetical protein